MTLSGPRQDLEKNSIKTRLIVADQAVFGQVIANSVTSPIAESGVVPGTYTLATVTVDSLGRVISAANGTAPSPPLSSGISTLTGDSGGPVGPNGAGNVNLSGTAGQIQVAGNSGTNTLTMSIPNDYKIGDTTANTANEINGGTSGLAINSANGIVVTAGDIKLQTSPDTNPGGINIVSRREVANANSITNDGAWFVCEFTNRTIAASPAPPVAFSISLGAIGANRYISGLTCYTLDNTADANLVITKSYLQGSSLICLLSNPGTVDLTGATIYISGMIGNAVLII